MKKRKKTTPKRQNVASADYAKFVGQLKKKIRSAQFKAALAVNRELIQLYWDIGREIVQRQEKDGWGSGVVEKVAKDIQNEFPGIEGFSKTNMGRMRAFYLAYSNSPQLVGKLEELPIFNIPWGHNVAIFEGVKSLDERLWYANMVIQEDWSRNALLDSIKIKIYKRYGKAVTNFHKEINLAKKCITSTSSSDMGNYMETEAQNVLRGSGNTVQQVRGVMANRITKLKISGPIDVTLTRAPESSIVIRIDDNVIDHIKTDVLGEELSVYPDPYPQKAIEIANKIQVAINLPNIPNIVTNGTGSIRSIGKWTFEELMISLSGSGNVEIANLTGKKLTSSIKGSSNLQVQNGDLQTHNIQVSGSGNCNVPNLSSKNAKIIISGSGSASVNVSNKMDVRGLGKW